MEVGVGVGIEVGVGIAGVTIGVGMEVGVGFGVGRSVWVCAFVRALQSKTKTYHRGWGRCYASAHVTANKSTPFALRGRQRATKVSEALAWSATLGLSSASQCPARGSRLA